MIGLNFENILVENNEGIVTISMNRPDRLNAWTRKMGAEMEAVIALGNITGSGTQCVNTVEYFTMSTLGNSQDFGDVSTASEFYTAASSSTRCVWHINAAQGGDSDKLEYVQIMTTGNGIDFGDCTERQRTSGCSNGHGGL